MLRDPLPTTRRHKKQWTPGLHRPSCAGARVGTVNQKESRNRYRRRRQAWNFRLGTAQAPATNRNDAFWAESRHGAGSRSTASLPSFAPPHAPSAGAARSSRQQNTASLNNISRVGPRPLRNAFRVNNEGGRPRSGTFLNDSMGESIAAGDSGADVTVCRIYKPNWEGQAGSPLVNRPLGCTYMKSFP
ncbi:hypothetical protein EVAR_95758_1 [Eumeta japonica]|uniref:Uncharacterized protein n=1 Tax=Eumeta variegata TaxID=151549 RepID=A0A4C1ULW8_EUMVA|nr:hypothetical protein EVAR_95758_1 [Eumeta japonica]